MRTKLAALCLVLNTLPIHADEHQKLTSLRTSWERARVQATEPVDAKYKIALEQLRDGFSKSGDLTSALAVQAEIDKLTGAAASSPIPLPPSRSSKKFKYRYQFVADSCEYTVAVERAKAAGGIVAFPRDERDLKEFRDLADEAKVSQIWIGVTREPFADSKWICSDGSELEPQLRSKVRNVDSVNNTCIRLGNGPFLNTHHPAAAIPFIIAIPEDK